MKKSLKANSMRRFIIYINSKDHAQKTLNLYLIKKTLYFKCEGEENANIEKKKHLIFLFVWILALDVLTKLNLQCVAM